MDQGLWLGMGLRVGGVKYMRLQRMSDGERLAYATVHQAGSMARAQMLAEGWG